MKQDLRRCDVRISWINTDATYNGRAWPASQEVTEMLTPKHALFRQPTLRDNTIQLKWQKYEPAPVRTEVDRESAHSASYGRNRLMVYAVNVQADESLVSRVPCRAGRRIPPNPLERPFVPQGIRR
jgi:hypothetical protein